ncbi:MAG TPA: ABC transporter permease [Streptosporangiaceae bacterium]|nr:ABC transporter permease [Streptosporangiaceae bacterium]
MRGQGAPLAVRRALSEKGLFAAACLTTLLATTVLVALGGYTWAVTDSGARRTLAHSPTGQIETRIAARTTGATYAATERAVRAGVAGAYAGVPVTQAVSARGDSYTLPGERRARRPRLTTFAMYSRIEEHATLRQGRWPRPGPTGASGGVVEAALPAPAARAMKMSVGGAYTVHGRLDGRAARVRITGLFTANRADDPFWSGDPLVVRGVQALSYTTFGPLVVAPETFVRDFARAGVTVRWWVLPDVRAIEPRRFGALADGVAGLGDRLTAADRAAEYTVVTDLPRLLTRLDQASLVSRSMMAIPLLQLLVLAGYALLLVARLLAEHRRMETAVLRARGATLRQLSVLTVGEGVLLTAPAVVAAPLLAPALLRLAGSASIITDTGLRLDVTPSPAMWAAAALAAAGCALALTLPALHDVTRSHAAARATRGRGARRGVLQRAGADVALAVVAALGVWQLVRYGRPVTEQAGQAGENGQALGVDPFIVAGPALALLAGAALVLRIVPIVARVAERVTSRREALAPALGAWQVSRRPLRYTGPALLLVMAIAVGVLSVLAGVTWRHSQLDQADFQAGADLRISPARDGAGPAPLGQGAAFGALPGVTAASPVLRKRSSAGNQEVTVLAVDAAKAGALLGPRLDAPAGTVPRTVAPPAAAVPGRSDRLTIDVRIVPDGPRRDPGRLTRNRLSALVVDALGVVWTVDFGGTPGDGRFHPRTADLAALAGPGGRPGHPIAIRGFRYEYTEDVTTPPLTMSIRLRDAAGAAGAGLRPPAGSTWSGSFRPAGAGQSLQRVAADANTTDAADAADAGELTVELPRVAAATDFFRASANARLTAVLGRPGERPAEVAPPLPGIVTAALARRAGVGVGGLITLTEPYGPQPVRVTAIVPALPSTSPDDPGVLVDWRAYADRSAVMTGTDTAPTEWWAATLGDTGPAVRALNRHPSWTTEVVDRMALRRELRDAPLGAALQGAFVLGFLAALGLAVVGFAVNAAVSARERRAEFAILRALGVSTRQVFGMLGVEQLFLVLIGLAGGLTLGLAIGRVVIPHSVLTVGATAPFPPVRLIVPWPPILALLAIVPALLAVVLALLVRSLRRQGLGAAIRIGEDR